MRVDFREQLGVSERPLAHPGDGLVQTTAEFGEPILGLGGDYRERFSRDQTVSLQAPQNLHQHFLGNIRDLPLQLAEPPSAIEQAV